MNSEIKYFLGIDGGGTKTACMLADTGGQILAECVGHGTSCRQYGWDEISAELKRLISVCCQKANLSKQALTGLTFALPCYGENAFIDHKLEDIAALLSGGRKFYLTNDVEAGFAGSLGLNPGIHVVAGTGSIAYGKDENGTYARCGGWSEHFSDIGSCYWIGKKVMEGFAKEADGIIESNVLHQILCRELELINDMDFIAYAEKEVLPFRDKTAAFQKYMLLAAQGGDPYAKTVYKEGAKELFSIISGVKNKLHFIKSPVHISYSGGLFHAGEYVLPTLEELVKGAGAVLCRPAFTPVQGAVLLAAKKTLPDCSNSILQKMMCTWNAKSLWSNKPD